MSIEQPGELPMTNYISPDLDLIVEHYRTFLPNLSNELFNGEQIRISQNAQMAVKKLDIMSYVSNRNQTIVQGFLASHNTGKSDCLTSKHVDQAKMYDIIENNTNQTSTINKYRLLENTTPKTNQDNLDNSINRSNRKPEYECRGSPIKELFTNEKLKIMVDEPLSTYISKNNKDSPSNKDKKFAEKSKFCKKKGRQSPRMRTFMTTNDQNDGKITREDKNNPETNERWQALSLAAVGEMGAPVILPPGDGDLLRGRSKMWKNN